MQRCLRISSDSRIRFRDRQAFAIFCISATGAPKPIPTHPSPLAYARTAMAIFHNPDDPQEVLKDLGEGRNWVDPDTPHCAWDNNSQRPCIAQSGVWDKCATKFLRSGDALVAFQLLELSDVEAVWLRCRFGIIQCVRKNGWWCLTVPIVYMWNQYDVVRVNVRERNGEEHEMIDTPILLRHVLIEDHARRRSAALSPHGDMPPIVHEYSTAVARYHGNELHLSQKEGEGVN